MRFLIYPAYWRGFLLLAFMGCLFRLLCIGTRLNVEAGAINDRSPDALHELVLKELKEGGSNA